MDLGGLLIRQGLKNVKGGKERRKEWREEKEREGGEAKGAYRDEGIPNQNPKYATAYYNNTKSSLYVSNFEIMP